MATRWQQSNQLYRRYVRNLALTYQKRQDIKMFTELLLTLSVTILFAVFAIRPTVITIVELGKDIDSKKETNQKLDAKIQALNQADTLYSSNLSAIQVINEAIPSDPFPAFYARQIEGVAKRHNITIVSMGTENVPLVASQVEAVESIPVDPSLIATDDFPSDAQSFDFKINLTGDYQSVVGFLTDFENMRFPIFEDSLSMQVSQGDLGGDLIVTISGRLAYLP